MAHEGKDHTLLHTLLVQAYQHLWFVTLNGIYKGFAFVGRTRSFLAPLRLAIDCAPVVTGNFVVRCAPNPSR